MKWLITYAASLVAFLIVDGLWIYFVARNMYQRIAGDSMRAKAKLVPGIVFYLMYVGGVLAFAVLPLTRYFDGKSIGSLLVLKVAAWGFGLGLFAYGTFSLTNQSLLKDWSVKLVSDVLWGGVLTAAISTVGFVVIRTLS